MSGPAPKSADRRSRRNKTSGDQTILRFERADQPSLPNSIPWPDETLAWWNNWGKSPQAELFSATDWDFLMDTAVLHADMWGNGNTAVLPELRIRTSRLGATLADRAQLRITLAEADDADSKRPDVSGASARERRGGKRVVTSVTDLTVVREKKKA